MNQSINILIKVFVRTFYQENASFFLFVIGLSCGFMSGVEHIALAQFFISSPLLTLIPVAIWVIYALKLINFNKTVLKRSENTFSFDLILYTSSEQCVISFVIVLLQFIPAILYGGFLVLSAARENMYQPILMISGCLVVICIGISLSLLHNFHNPDKDKKIGWISRLISRYVRPYPFFIVEWITRKHAIVLAGSKAAGSFFLFGVLQLYRYDVYDERLLGMAGVMAVAIGAQLIFEIHRFENFHFNMVRQLPVSFVNRASRTTICFVFLFLMETGVIITYFPPNLSFTILISVLALVYSCHIFFYGLLYRKSSSNPELQMKLTFIFSMVWILMILFKIPLAAIAILNFIVGLYYWNRYYYSFETV